MEQETKQANWKLRMALALACVVAAVPLARWAMRVNSEDVSLSNEEYSAFNSPEGEIKKPAGTQQNPDLTETGYLLRYKSPGDSPAPRGMPQAEPVRARQQTQQQEQEQVYAPKPAQAGLVSPRGPGGQSPQAQKDMKQMEQKSVGFVRGLLTSTAGLIVNNPRAMGALANNTYVVEGYMSRPVVKKALGSSQGLQTYLSNPKVINNFLGNEVVKTVLANPQVIDVLASSAMADAIRTSPAFVETLNNPANKEAMERVLAKEPQVIDLLSNPNVMNAFMRDPQIHHAAKEFSDKYGKIRR